MDVYPKDFSEYQRYWQNLDPKGSSEGATIEQLRKFMLGLWSSVYSTRELERIRAATNEVELESAVRPFWLTPRRIRLRVEEAFAGTGKGDFVLYTGLGGGDCGIDFHVGERWLVEAYRDDAGRWIAHLCSVTIPAIQADAVLAQLRAGHP